jgi:hypothetical protein
MRKSITRALTVAAPVGAAMLFVGCGATGAADEPASAPTAAGSGPQTTQSGATGITEPEQPEPDPAQIVVRDGKPVGGVARLEYERGERVRFTVVSDSADEVHVHGFDLAKDVAAGGSAHFDFRADFEGVFEVELEGAHVQIAELRIEP